MSYKKIFYFGEKHRDYEVRVFNEREVRASAGILLALASIAFSNAYFVSNFQPLKYFIILFLLDFSIRLFINPKFSPTLTLGRILVSNQKPEYSGAPQKKFAWYMGLTLATFMFYRVVLMGLTGPINLAICLICLTLLFCEAVLGICVGCYIYSLIFKEKAKLCPGGVCEINIKQDIQKTDTIQAGILGFFILLFTLLIKNNVLPSRGLLQTNNLNWTIFDYLVMLSIIVVFTALYNLAIKRFERHKILVTFTSIILFLYIWAELAVGVFFNIGS